MTTWCTMLTEWNREGDKVVSYPLFIKLGENELGYIKDCFGRVKDLPAAKIVTDVTKEYSAKGCMTLYADKNRANLDPAESDIVLTVEPTGDVFIKVATPVRVCGESYGNRIEFTDSVKVDELSTGGEYVIDREFAEVFLESIFELDSQDHANVAEEYAKEIGVERLKAVFEASGMGIPSWLSEIS